MRAAVADIRLARHYAWTGQVQNSISIEQVSGVILRTNLLNNTDFSSYWSILRCDKSGGQLTVNAIGYWPRFLIGGVPSPAGSSYTASVQITGPATTQHKLGIQFINSTGVGINAPNAVDGITAASGYSGRLTISGTAPDKSVTANIFLGVPNNSPVGTTAAFSQPIYENSSTPGRSFFDGSTVVNATNINDPIGAGTA